MTSKLKLGLAAAGVAAGFAVMATAPASAAPLDTARAIVDGKTAVDYSQYYRGRGYARGPGWYGRRGYYGRGFYGRGFYGRPYYGYYGRPYYRGYYGRPYGWGYGPAALGAGIVGLAAGAALGAPYYGYYGW